MISIPCANLQTCNVYLTGSAPVTKPDRTVRGTMFWLLAVKGAGESQLATFTTFRLFVPAS
jgi:hypothetical protein